MVMVAITKKWSTCNLAMSTGALQRENLVSFLMPCRTAACTQLSTVHAGGYMVVATVTITHVLDLPPGNVYWCTAA